jgi:hypothetical protein
LLNYFNISEEKIIEKENFLFMADYLYQSISLIYSFEIDDTQKEEMEDISNDLFKNSENILIKDLKEVLGRNEFLNEILDNTRKKLAMIKE